MRLLLARLRELVWPAVLAAVFATASVLVGIFLPDAISAAISLGLAAVTMALLANRA
jgi:predicted permease